MLEMKGKALGRNSKGIRLGGMTGARELGMTKELRRLDGMTGKRRIVEKIVRKCNKVENYSYL